MKGLAKLLRLEWLRTRFRPRPEFLWYYDYYTKTGFSRGDPDHVRLEFDQIERLTGDAILERLIPFVLQNRRKVAERHRDAVAARVVALSLDESDFEHYAPCAAESDCRD